MGKLTANSLKYIVTLTVAGFTAKGAKTLKQQTNGEIVKKREGQIPLCMELQGKE